MTKGDKIKLRAELAGNAMQGLMGGEQMWKKSAKESVIKGAVEMADALMAELGISMEDDK